VDREKGWIEERTIGPVMNQLLRLAAERMSITGRRVGAKKGLHLNIFAAKKLEAGQSLTQCEEAAIGEVHTHQWTRMVWRA
jgi:hypothetical protein